MEKIAGFDIGSNAVRLVLAEIDLNGKLTLLKKVRVPLRLGTEAFEDKTFSEFTISYAAKIFKDLERVISQEKIDRYWAVATSALREAKNAKVLEDAIFNSSGIKIQTISGDKEASLILKAIQHVYDLKNKDYLLVDIGGGSVEVSMLCNEKICGSKSFELGTIRLLEIYKRFGSDSKEVGAFLKNGKKEVDTFVNTLGLPTFPIDVIGTGGNFRSLAKLRKKILLKQSSDIIYPQDLPLMIKELEKTPYLKRIKKFKLRADRADVIIPATKIIQMIVEERNIKKIVCPNLGLVHGVIFEMCQNKFKEYRDLSND